MPVLLIEDNDYRKFEPISRTRFLWDISFGMHNPFVRWGKQFPDVRVLSVRFPDSLYQLLSEDFSGRKYNKKETYSTVINSLYVPENRLQPELGKIGITAEGKFVYLHGANITFDEIESLLHGQYEGLTKKYTVEEVKAGVFVDSLAGLIRHNAQALNLDATFLKGDNSFVSSSPNIYIHREATVQQYVSLQADDGAIVIDKGAKVRSFSIIDGPGYVGEDSLIDSAKIRPGVTIRNNCRIGGEIEASVVEGFTNKHHEGFIGHSYLGSWVNIGALTTTSDLKNNYGEIRIEIDGKVVSTGAIKFGSVICDYTKIGIGMMLNTGTVISPGCCLFPENISLPKYIQPFSWGVKGRYEIDRFIADTQKMMARRGQELSLMKERFLRELYHQSIIV